MLKPTMYDSNDLRSMGVECGDNCLVDHTVKLLTPDKLVLTDNVRIDAFCVLRGDIVIRRNTHISVGCMLLAGRESIRMGVNSNMSAYSRIYAESDDLSGRGLIGPCVHESTRHVHRGRVVMDAYTCLGPNAIMMPNSHLRWGSNLMSFSILLGDTEPEGLYQGVPAKRIRERLPTWKKHVQSFASPLDQHLSVERECGELHGND